MRIIFSCLTKKLLLQTLLLSGLMSLHSIAYATAKEATQGQAQPQAQTQSVHLGEDPGPVYLQTVLQWAKVTNFAQNAAEVIVGKFKLEMENDPKLKEVMSKELLTDLEQFFYELFLSPETIKQLAIVYSQYFTLDEMSELIKFYQSPVGQKLIKADPELKIKTQQIGHNLLKSHEREYMSIVGKYILKNKDKAKDQDKAKTQ